MSNSAIFHNSRVNNSGCSNRGDLRSYSHYIVAKFGADWSIFADATV